MEGQTGLYVFFKSVCDLYDLLPAENYKLPPEAEGLEIPSIEHEIEKPPPQILKPPSQQRGPPPSEDDNLHPVRTNTRRHIRSSPSTGSAVTTVIEAEEEEADGVARRMKEMHLAPPETVEEEIEVEVPVIVEQPAASKPNRKDVSPPSQDVEEDQEEGGDESDADQTIVNIDSGQEPEKEENAKSEESSAPTTDPIEPSVTKKEAVSEETKEATEPAAAVSTENSDPKDQGTAEPPADDEKKEAKEESSEASKEETASKGESKVDEK